MASNPADYVQTYIRLRSPGAGWAAPPELRPRLVADAIAQQTSLTDVVCRILSTAYGVPVDESSTRRTSPRDDQDVLNVRLPRELVRVIAVVGQQRTPRRTAQKEILTALSAHYGMRLPARLPRRRRRRAAAAGA